MKGLGRGRGVPACCRLTTRSRGGRQTGKDSTYYCPDMIALEQFLPLDYIVST